MEGDHDFKASGVRQVKIDMKWVWIVAAATMVLLIITGPMLWLASTSRPATVNTGGYTNLEKW